MYDEMIFYSCRCRLCFLLQASRGSRDESPDISHSYRRLCCAGKYIGREPEEQTTLYLNKSPEKDVDGLILRKDVSRLFDYEFALMVV